MSDNVSPTTQPCTTYEWCRQAHTSPDDPHYHYLDLVEHLDDSGCVFEVAVYDYGTPERRYVSLLFTDTGPDRTRHTLHLPQETAGTIARIIQLFDRRGLRELAELLDEAAVMLAEDPLR